VARSNILVNKPIETKYFYQDLDSSGARLTGKNSYTVPFAMGQVPPVKGFWSLTLLQRASFLPSKRAKALLAGHKEQDATVRSRWLADDLRRSEAARRGATLELAAVAEASSPSTFGRIGGRCDHRQHLDAARGRARVAVSVQGTTNTQRANRDESSNGDA
jgi:hypothetical protein